jgi:hypothetical protein
MKETETDLLHKILDKIDQMEENWKVRAFLSKFDMMVSFLLTFTVFATGLLLNSVTSMAHSEIRIILPLGIGLIFLLLFVIQGEVRAILSDDIERRFNYWMTLIVDVLFVLCISIPVGLCLLNHPFAVFILSVTGLPIMILFLWLVGWADSAFDWYNNQMYSRKLHWKSRISYVKTMVVGLIIFVATFITSNFLPVPM